MFQIVLNLLKVSTFPVVLKADISNPLTFVDCIVVVISKCPKLAPVSTFPVVLKADVSNPLTFVD